MAAMEDVDQWLREGRDGGTGRGQPDHRFVNDVYSMRVLLERLTPTQDRGSYATTSTVHASIIIR